MPHCRVSSGTKPPACASRSVTCHSCCTADCARPPNVCRGCIAVHALCAGRSRRRLRLPSWQVCLLTNPIWVVKTRLQLQRVSRMKSASAAASRGAAARRAGLRASVTSPYRGFADAVGQIAREEGFRGFYRGLLPSLLLVSAPHAPPCLRAWRHHGHPCWC